MMTVFINFSELPSWLGLRPLQQLCVDTGCELEWRPMLGSLGNVTSTNVQPGEVDPLAAYKARRAKARHMAAKRENERMCEILGITAEQGERQIDPLCLSLGLLWLAESNASTMQYFEYSLLGFERGFRSAADVESTVGVAEVLEAAGISSGGFDDFAQSNAGDLEAGRDAMLESGILNAPAFLLQGEIFHGREHLPLIGWILGGRVGIPPV